MTSSEIHDLLRASAGLPADVMERLADLGGVGFFNIHLPTGDISLNRNTAMFTGYEPGDIPHSSNTKQMLTYEDDWPMVAHAMEQLVSGQQSSYHLEYRMRRRDSSLVSIAETAVVYERDKDGKALRIAGMGLDLSRLRWAEQKARDMERENRRLALGMSTDMLAEENRLLRAANAAATIVIGGFHQNYEEVLRQALQLLGESVQADRAYIWRNTNVDGRLFCFQRCEWMKNTFAPVLPEGTQVAYDDIIPGWQQVMVPGKALFATRDDNTNDVEIPAGMETVQSLMLVPLYLHGDFWGFIGFEDRTSGRRFTQLEADIMSAGALVIASSISRNETFSKLSQAREAALASTQAKGEFLSRMSHEIRTPMNAIIGMTTIAKKTEDPEKIRYCLSKIDTSSKQLLSIINDVLDMSKIDANKFEVLPAPFDFERMLQNVLSVVQVKLDEKRQSLYLDINKPFTRMIISDELRLSQVLINLLNNAIKFTPENGKITLHIVSSPIDESHSHLRVSVEDTGIGIDPAKQEKLFQSFEQADGSITRQYGGTGLGLAISKKIINLLGGNIWVKSIPGEGSDFIFEIEVAWGDALTVKAGPLSTKNPPRILVVDDIREELEYFQTILAGYNLSCDVAGSGREALALVRESIAAGTPYDILFVDWNMPDMNGGATAKAIQDLMGNKAMVVMISVADWADIEPEARDNGVDHFLAKPILPRIMYDTISDLTGGTPGSNAAKPSPVENTLPNWQDKTLLLAEDIEINREIVQAMLEPAGVTLVTAADGLEAVQAFAKEPTRFDVILMDVQMPNMDGMEATRRIRAMDAPNAKTIPIIAMTANAFKEDEEHSMAAGMNRHLTKPLDTDVLIDALCEYLGK